MTEMKNRGPTCNRDESLVVDIDCVAVVANDFDECKEG